MTALRTLAFLITGAAVLAGCSHSAPATEAVPATTPAAMAKGPAMPAGVTAQMIATGDSIFKNGSCQRCHGMDGKGTVRGANLVDATWAQISGSYPEIVKIITDGVPKESIKMTGAPFAMKARGGMSLTDDQVRQVAAYVYSISHT